MCEEQLNTVLRQIDNLISTLVNKEDWATISELSKIRQYVVHMADMWAVEHLLRGNHAE